MLYIFVDIKIDSLHFIESLKANLSSEGEISLVSTIQFVATLQAAAKALREEGFTVQVNWPHRTSPTRCDDLSERKVSSVVPAGAPVQAPLPRGDPGLHLPGHEEQPQPGVPGGRQVLYSAMFVRFTKRLALIPLYLTVNSVFCMCTRVTALSVHYTLQGVPLKLPPLNFLSTRSHVNWPKIPLSARGHTGILYLDKFRGGNFSGTPCSNQ